jgi:hypothetical protein
MAAAQPRRLLIRIALAVAVLCVASLFIHADSVAAVKPRVKAVSTRVLGVGPNPANYDVSCPRGLKAVGGGFSTFALSVAGDPNLVPGGGPVTAVVPVVLESRRLDARTWRITERAAANPAAGPVAPGGTSVVASVYCRKVKGRVTAVEGVGAPSNASSSPSTTDPRCPGGRVALSGGWSLAATPESGFFYPSVYESFRDGSRAWRTSAVPGTEARVALLGFAYCARERKPPRTSRRTVSAGTASASCAKRRAAAAGGFQSAPGAVIQLSTGTTGGKKRGYPPYRAYPAGPVWFVAPGPFDAAGVTTTAFAYCS